MDRKMTIKKRLIAKTRKEAKGDSWYAKGKAISFSLVTLKKKEFSQVQPNSDTLRVD